jgi:hypothetical protein
LASIWQFFADRAKATSDLSERKIYSQCRRRMLENYPQMSAAGGEAVWLRVLSIGNPEDRRPSLEKPSCLLFSRRLLTPPLYGCIAFGQERFASADCNV